MLKIVSIVQVIFYASKTIKMQRIYVCVWKFTSYLGLL